MSLATSLANLATRIATEAKALRTLINGNAADLSGLTTTAKGNLVAAINEVKASASTGATINDAATSSTSVWSSNKTNTTINTAVAGLVNAAPAALDTLKELSDALGGDASFAATTSTALGNRVRTDTATQGLTGTQQTNARTNIDAASATAVGDTSTDFVATFNAGLV